MASWVESTMTLSVAVSTVLQLADSKTSTPAPVNLPYTLNCEEPLNLSRLPLSGH